MMESIVSHLVMFAAGAGIVWFLDRSPKRQFHLFMDAVDNNKIQDKDWRFVRDASGKPTGIRVMYSASAESDRGGV